MPHSGTTKAEIRQPGESSACGRKISKYSPRIYKTLFSATVPAEVWFLTASCICLPHPCSHSQSVNYWFQRGGLMSPWQRTAGWERIILINYEFTTASTFLNKIIGLAFF